MNFPRQNAAVATAMIVISACSFGSLSTLMVLIAREGVSVSNAMLWRYVVAVAVMLIVIRDMSRLNIGRQRALRLMVISGIGQTAITYSTLSSLRYIDVSSLGFLFYTYPAWMAVVAAIRRTEPLTRIRLGALGLALLGLAVMFASPKAVSPNVVGAMMALTAAFLYSLYLPAIESAQREIEPMTAAFYITLGVAISFCTLSVIRMDVSPPESPKAWEYVMLMAVVCTVLAFRMLLGGLSVLKPVRTSIVSTIEPFFTMLLGALILGEKLTGAILFGGILIAGAVLLLQWRDAGAETITLPAANPDTDSKP